MRAFLVAVELPGSRRWHVSLDPSLRADMLYHGWRSPSVRLWRTVRPLPLGRALAEAERLNEREGRRLVRFWAGRTRDEPVLVPVDGFAEEAEGKTGRPTGTPGEPAGASGRLPPSSDKLPESREGCAASGPGGNPAAADGCEAVLDKIEAAMDRLAEAMEGRSLLAEEFESLVRSLDLRDAGGDWRFIAQWGCLSGRFSLRAGVSAGRFARSFGASRPAFPALGRERAVCHRCGADERRMRRTACASCGEWCLYCERCLTMGRARACTPLITGADKPSVAGNAKHRRPDRADARTAKRVRPDPAVAAAADGKRRGHVAGKATGGRRDRHAALKEGGDQPHRRLAVTRAECGSVTADDALAADAVAAALAAVPGLSLSPMQEEAAREAVRFVLADRPGNPGSAVRPFLIWAVTGAGKTEMVFPLIAAERARGGRVVVATPRKDVVLELIPRIAAAFPDEKVEGLYGGIGRRWPTGGIMVATTHQLIRYEAAFDLVVLDEVDAFPFHGDPMLAYAARKAAKPGAAFVMLSATPPPGMQRAVRKGRLPCALVPVRHHRHPLPVPSCARPASLSAFLAQSLRRGAQAFVFVPRIAKLEPELARLRKALADVCPPERLDATSSRDPMREEKVRRLRSGDIRVLLTTTILERGVTIPKADVYVLDADHRLFDAAALVQMAGRAGRSSQDPAGRVVFLASRRTREMRRAIREIRWMNRLARQKGHIAETGDPENRRFGLWRWAAWMKRPE